MDLRRFICIAVLGSSAVMTGTLPARAASRAYIRLQGAKQGQFSGQARGKDKWIPLLAFNYSAQSPRDAATGQASGKRQWKPITIVKEVDATSPQLARALETGEMITSADIEFVRTDSSGKEEVYKTLHLTNGRINSMRRLALPSGRPREEVVFAFQKIVFSDNRGNVIAPRAWIETK